MIKCVFTLDYEIYGNGEGSLADLVLEPTRQLASVFEEFNSTFVVFAEAVEFPKIEEAQSDPDTREVRAQLRSLRANGHEIALHLHPWWSRAGYKNGRWLFDWSERNICSLSEERIESIVSEAIKYLRDALQDDAFTPVSFRSGLWLMQPTALIADVLARHGISVDSSVFHGGKVSSLGLDYRAASANGSSWRFSDDVNVADRDGKLLEVPIYSQMVPFWKMLGGKRLKLQRKAQSTGQGSPAPRQLRDFLRFRYPRKFDFCRMTFEEMRNSVESAVAEFESSGNGSGLIVAIGHSKDFIDPDATRRILAFLKHRSIPATTFSSALAMEHALTC